MVAGSWISAAMELSAEIDWERRHYRQRHGPRFAMSIVHRRARKGANFAFLAVDAVHRVRRYRRRRQCEGHILGLINLIDRVRLRIIAMEISLGDLRIRGRCYPERKRATIAPSDAFGRMVRS